MNAYLWAKVTEGVHHHRRPQRVKEPMVESVQETCYGAGQSRGHGAICQQEVEKTGAMADRPELDSSPSWSGVTDGLHLASRSRLSCLKRRT